MRTLRPSHRSSRDARAVSVLQAELEAATARIAEAEEDVDHANERADSAAKAGIAALDELIEDLERISEAAAELATASREHLIIQLMPFAAVGFD